MIDRGAPGSVEELCNAVLELVSKNSNGQMMTDDE